MKKNIAITILLLALAWALIYAFYCQTVAEHQERLAKEYVRFAQEQAYKDRKDVAEAVKARQLAEEQTKQCEELRKIAEAKALGQKAIKHN